MSWAAKPWNFSNCAGGVRNGGERGGGMYLLLPALDFFHQEVVALVNLRDLGVHASLEVDVILPRLHGITRVLVPLADDLVKMAQ